MEYSYELFPQLDTMMEYQNRNNVFCNAEYYYQQPASRAILDSEDVLFPSTVHQQTYPVYNNQPSLKEVDNHYHYHNHHQQQQQPQQQQQQQQQQQYYTYSIDMSLLTPPTETYDIHQQQQQWYQSPLPVTFDGNEVKNIQSTMSSPSSCFSSVSSFVEDPAPTSRLYQCEYKGCTKTFTRTYNLKSHRRTHTDEKPFVCNLCSKAFARQHDRNRHAKLHLGLKPYPCQYCDKSFARQDALNRHLKRDKKGNIHKAKNYDSPPPCLLIKLRQKNLAIKKKK